MPLMCALAGLPQPALAECSLDTCSDVRITGVYTYGAYSPGWAWIETSGTETQLTTCTADSGKLLRVDSGDLKSDWLFSHIMTAYQTGETLRVRVTGGGGVCRVLDLYGKK